MADFASLRRPIKGFAVTRLPTGESGRAARPEPHISGRVSCPDCGCCRAAATEGGKIREILALGVLQKQKQEIKLSRAGKKIEKLTKRW